MVFLAFFVGNLYNKSKPLTKKGMRTMMQSYEKQRELVSKLNVIDDVLFHKVVEDKEVCEEILRIILNKPDLAVVESQPQRFLRNLGAHSVILDVLCQDSSGDYFKKSTGVHQKFQKLSNRVQYFKESQKGVTEMCELVEEYAKNMQKRK